MKTFSSIILFALLLTTFGALPSYAQESGDNFRSQFNRHFRNASRVLQLAKAMPAEKYSWRPGEGVSSVEEVYTHIAAYNFQYPRNSLGIPAPDDVEVDKIESITGKKEVVAILERSIDHVTAAIEQMPDSKFSEPAELYGRTVTGQAVLMQLITHMSEHVGQSIAYARVNGVVPPWNR